MKKLVVILGPTASGKTELSVKLSKKFGGEIVSADSRQVYKRMDIGTNKVSKKEMAGIPHHLLDVASPKRRFSVAQYQKLAVNSLRKILKKGKLPFLAGGSPFYIYSIVNGWQFPKLKPDLKLRKTFEKKTVEELFSILKKIDAERAETIEKKNKRRLIRATEIAKTLGKVPQLKKKPLFDCLLIGVKKNPKELKKAIKERIEKRLRKGLVEEVKKLKKSGVSWKRLIEFGLEYRWLSLYLQKKITKSQMMESLQKDTEKLAKKQMVWFKKDPRIKWIKNQREAERLIREFLNKIHQI